MSDVLQKCLASMDRLIVVDGCLLADDAAGAARGAPYDENLRFEYFIEMHGPSAGRSAGALMARADNHRDAIAAARRISKSWGGLAIIDQTEESLR